MGGHVWGVAFHSQAYFCVAGKRDRKHSLKGPYQMAVIFSFTQLIPDGAVITNSCLASLTNCWLLVSISFSLSLYLCLCIYLTLLLRRYVSKKPAHPWLPFFWDDVHCYSRLVFWRMERQREVFAEGIGLNVFLWFWIFCFREMFHFISRERRFLSNNWIWFSTKELDSWKYIFFLKHQKLKSW